MHLLIGSEGTLGFISEIVYDTVEEMPCKASALIIFPGIREACVAAAILKGQPVAAVELMDRAALRAVADKKGMPEYLPTLSPAATALLVETRATETGRAAPQYRADLDSSRRNPPGAAPAVHRQCYRIQPGCGISAKDFSRPSGRSVGRARRSSSRMSPFPWRDLPRRPSNCRRSLAVMATVRPSSSVMPWMAICTLSSPRISAPGRRSSGTAA